MNTKDITNSELFDNLLDIKFEDYYLDFHNDFNLISIKYLIMDNCLELNLINIINSNNKINIVFEEIQDVKINILNDNDLTINNFYRGKYENDGNLFEDYLNKKCFYIEFENDGEIILLASKVLIKKANKD